MSFSIIIIIRTDELRKELESDKLQTSEANARSGNRGDTQADPEQCAPHPLPALLQPAAAAVCRSDSCGLDSAADWKKLHLNFPTAHECSMSSKLTAQLSLVFKGF